MKKHFSHTLPAAFLTGVAVTLAALTAARAETTVGSGRVASENRTVGSFHGVETTGSSATTVTQGDNEGLVVEAEDNLLPLIESSVGADGVLHLGFRKDSGNIRTNEPVRFRVTARSLDRLALLGSGTIRAGSLTAEKEASVDLPGSGEITVEHVRAASVSMRLAGSGKVKFADGKVDRQSVEIDGSGDYQAAGLATDEADVQINGSGNAVVRAARSLSVQINGSGDVRYHGHPAVKKQVIGSGKIEAAGE